MRLQYVLFDICVWINFVDLAWAFRVRRVLKCVFVSDRIKKENQPTNQPTNQTRMTATVIKQDPNT